MFIARVCLNRESLSRSESLIDTLSSSPAFSSWASFIAKDIIGYCTATGSVRVAERSGYLSTSTVSRPEGVLVESDGPESAVF